MLQKYEDEDDINYRLRFFKELQAITNKIHATINVEQIMLGLSRDICHLFDSDRLTLYAVNEKKNSIESKIKTGLKSYKDFALPISEKSIAGYVALSKSSVNIQNVYDEAELKAYSPGLHFQKKVDLRTGYRTRQMLAGPLINPENGELLGVLQLINNRVGRTFSSLREEGLKDLCETLGIAFAQRLKPPPPVRTKFDFLVTEAILSTPELDLASRAARRKGVNVEDVLAEEFQVRMSDIGESLAQFFGVCYEPYQPGLVKPDALKNFKRAYVEHNHWLVLEEDGDKLMVVSTDPDRIIGSRIVQNFFPKTNVTYCVTTHREFRQMVEQFFGSSEKAKSADEESSEMSDTVVATDAENALSNLVSETIAIAFKLAAPQIQIELRSRDDKLVSRLRKDGSVQRISGLVLVDFSMDFPDSGSTDSAS